MNAPADIKPNRLKEGESRYFNREMSWLAFNRRVLEEAAGISGLYARRHEAELKLQGAEQNLTRVDDVLEQLAQQLSVLNRQARQAQRGQPVAPGRSQFEGPC